MRDHANAHGGDLEDSDLPGMMTQDEMHDLEAMSGEGIEERWLEMMIEHHEGAIDLAEQIRDGQQAEVEQMEQMLGS
jgi:uncharacterized protein (DUF305 family)